VALAADQIWIVAQVILSPAAFVARALARSGGFSRRSNLDCGAGDLFLNPQAGSPAIPVGQVILSPAIDGPAAHQC
jgi:hypothetical protein